MRLRSVREIKPGGSAQAGLSRRVQCSEVNPRGVPAKTKYITVAPEGCNGDGLARYGSSKLRMRSTADWIVRIVSRLK